MVPAPRPMHVPQPGGSSIAPASSSELQCPSALAFAITSALAAARYISTPGATFLPFITVAAVAMSSYRAFTQLISHALWIFTCLGSISGRLVIVFTSFGPEICGTTVARSSSSSIAYFASLSAAKSCLRAHQDSTSRLVYDPREPERRTPGRLSAAKYSARASRYSFRTASNGKTPASAPHSVLMFAMLIR